MKFSLMFLLAFVASSYQQHPYNHPLWWSLPISPYARSSGPQHRGFDEEAPAVEQPANVFDTIVDGQTASQSDNNQQEDGSSQPMYLRYDHDSLDGSYNSPVYSPFARVNVYPEEIRPAFVDHPFEPMYPAQTRDESEGFYIESPEEQLYNYQQQVESRKRPSFFNNAGGKFGGLSFPSSIKLQPLAKKPPTAFKLPDLKAKIVPAVKLPQIAPIRPVVATNKNNRLSPENRLFFNLFNQNGYVVIPSTNTNNNNFRFPFGKTTAIIVTSTVNLTTVVSCIGASEFVTGNPTACRRRRRGIERLLSFDDEEDAINPSKLEKVEVTAMDPWKNYEERNARLHEVLESSKDDFIIAEDDGRSEGIVRDKRFFFNGGTTTFTSYTFINATVTKTVRLLTAGTTSGLTCLPGNFLVC